MFLLLCKHGFCNVSATLYNLSRVIKVDPRCTLVSTEVRGIGQGRSDCILQFSCLPVFSLHVNSVKKVRSAVHHGISKNHKGNDSEK